MRSASSAAILAALAIFVAACAGDGDDNGADDATATPESTPTPAATATRVPPPPRPSSFDQYAEEIARYLTADPGAGEGLACLSELFDAWGMPYFSGERSCRAGNTDADDDREVAVVLANEHPTLPGLTVFRVVLLDRTSTGFTVAHQSAPGEILDAENNRLGNAIVEMADINGDGAGEFVYAVPGCGATACWHNVFIATGEAAGYRLLTPPDGIFQTNSALRLEDEDGDGRRELILYGGTVGSAGAGPNRPRTDVYAWDGTLYALRSSTPDPPVFRYHAVLDADALFAARDYAGAERAYTRAATDASLTDSGINNNERAELAAYALYRAGVAVLAGNGDPARADQHFAAALASGGLLNAGLAGAFSAAYDASGSVPIACSAVLEHLQRNAEEFAQFWNFGYANPEFDPANVCPF